MPNESGRDRPVAEISVSVPGKRDAARTEEPDQVMARNIAGVRAERLAGYHDHRGSLVPFMDFTKPFWNEPIVHAYEFTIRPGRIKGWGMHRRQADRYFVQTGNLRIALYDGREGSPRRTPSASSGSRRTAISSSTSRRESGTRRRTGARRSGGS